MHVKKIIATVIMITLTVGLFANGQQEGTQEGPVTLKVLNYGDMATPEGQSFETLVEQFRAQYPDIELDYETLYDEQYHQKATAMLASGEVPHVFYIWPGPRSSYAFDAEVVTDQKKYINTEDYKAATMAPQGPNGEIWEVPLSFGVTSVLYMNTAVLDELGLKAPKTYADLKAMVAPAKAAGKMVISVASQEAWVNNSCVIGTFVGRYAGPGFFSNAVNGDVSFTDEAMIKALSFLQTAVKDEVIPPNSIQTDYGTALTNFVNGKALFLLDGHWRAGGFEDPAFAEKVEFISFPALPGENPAFAGTASGTVTPGYAVTTQAAEDGVEEAAAAFLNFISGPVGSKVRLDAMGFIPAYNMELDLSNIVEEHTKIVTAKKAAYYENLAGITDVPDAFLPAEVNNVFNNGLQELILMEKTPSQVAEEVASALDR